MPKYTELDPAGTITGAEIFAVVQAGDSLKTTVGDVSNYTLGQVDSSFITGELGFTPYDAANPDNFIDASALVGLATETYVNGQGFLTNITGKITPGTNVTFSGSGTAGSPYVINVPGGGGGSSAPADEIVFGTGAGLGSTSKFYRTSAVGVAEGQIIIGNSRTTSILNYRTDSESMVVIARNTDPTLSTNAHGYVDATIFDRTSSGNAYNSYGANVTYSNSSAYDHYVPFQSVFILGESASGADMTTYYHGFDYVTVDSGSNLTKRYGLYMQDGIGSGTIGYQCPLYVPTLAKGTQNWAVDIVNNDIRTGGNIRLTTTNSGTGDLTPKLNFYHASTIETGYILNRLNANSTQLEFYSSSSALSADRLILSLDGSDGSNANNRPNRAILNGIIQFSDITNVAPLDGQIWFEGGVFKKRQGGVTTNL